MKRLSRTAFKLSESVHQCLNMYALAASAAGVSLLALAHPAEARIVYTPAHIPINPSGAVAWLDLNHDGINDFQFKAAYQKTQGGFFRSSLAVAPVQTPNRVWAVHTNRGSICAAALPKGRTVGPRSPFQVGQSNLFMARASGETTVGSARVCPWVYVGQAYLGLKFVINAKVHFGWARIKMVGGGVGFPALIVGYAYETTPNKPIITGKTRTQSPGVGELNPASLTSSDSSAAMLGVLAMGAPGLSIWRREEPVGTTPGAPTSG